MATLNGFLCEVQDVKSLAGGAFQAFIALDSVAKELMGHMQGRSLCVRTMI